MTVTEAARKLHYSPDTVRAWCRQGLLKATKQTNGYWIEQADVDAFVPPARGRPANQPAVNANREQE